MHMLCTTSLQLMLSGPGLEHDINTDEGLSSDFLSLVEMSAGEIMCFKTTGSCTREKLMCLWLEKHMHSGVHAALKDIVSSF